MENAILEKLNQIEKTVSLNQKEVLTFDEVCTYTGLSRSHLYKLTCSNRIPHSKPHGKMLYFDRAELNNWLLQNPITTAQELEQQAVNYCYNTAKKGGAV